MNYGIFRTFLAVLFGFVLTATGLWASPADEEEPAAAMEKEMVTDPTTGKMVVTPQYGGTFTYASKDGHKNPDIVLSGFWGKRFISGVLEKPSITNWGIDRAEWDFAGSEAPLFTLNGALAESWEMPDDKTVIVKVRQGVHWHDKPPMNGRELTAHDIEYNFHRLMGLGSLPGLGRLMLIALNNRDYPVVSGINLFFATGVVVINLLIDLAYAVLDPRVRYD